MGNNLLGLFVLVERVKGVGVMLRVLGLKNHGRELICLVLEVERLDCGIDKCWRWN